LEIPIINSSSLHKHEADLLICDEIHNLSKKQKNELHKFNHVIGLTGSLGDDTRHSLKEIGLNVVFEYTIKEAIKDGIISDYNINVVTVPLNSKDKYIKAGSKDKPFYTTEKGQYDYLTKQFNRFKQMSWSNPKNTSIKMAFAGKRNRFITSCKSKIEVAKKIIDRTERCLVFTSLTDVADKLTDSSFHSKSEGDELDNFISKKINKLTVCNMVEMGKQSTFYTICNANNNTRSYNSGCGNNFMYQTNSTYFLTNLILDKTLLTKKLKKAIIKLGGIFNKLTDDEFKLVLKYGVTKKTHIILTSKNRYNLIHLFRIIRFYANSMMFQKTLKESNKNFIKILYYSNFCFGNGATKNNFSTYARRSNLQYNDNRFDKKLTFKKFIIASNKSINVNKPNSLFGTKIIANQVNKSAKELPEDINEFYKQLPTHLGN